MPYAAPDQRVRLNAALIAGLVTGAVGLSYLLEIYTSPAALQPFALLDWLPGHDGQRWWAWAYIAGGVLLCALGCGVWIHRVLRVIIALAGVGIWGGFGAATAYAALLGPDAHHTGTYGACTALGMVLCLALVLRQSAVVTDRDRLHRR